MGVGGKGAGLWPRAPGRHTAHSESERTRHLGTRSRLCPHGDGYHGQQPQVRDGRRHHAHRDFLGEFGKKINNCHIFFFPPLNKELGKQLRNKWFKLPTDPIKSKAPQTQACSYNEVKLTVLRLGVASAGDCLITQTNFPPLSPCIYLFILWACPTLDARVK